jgi:ABC-type transport system substrate-binding protein
MPSTGSYVLWMKRRRKPLDNPKVRQAGQPGDQPPGPVRRLPDPGADEDLALPAGRQPAGADAGGGRKLPGLPAGQDRGHGDRAELLQEAGIAPGTPIEILCANVAPHAELLAPAVQQMLNTLGFKASIRTLERALLVDERQVKGNFDIALDTSGMPTLDPTIGWLTYFKTGASGNFYKYSNADVDKWLDQLEVETDDTKRKALAKQIEDQLDKDGPWVNIGYTDHLPMWSAKVKGMGFEKRKFSSGTTSTQRGSTSRADVCRPTSSRGS